MQMQMQTQMGGLVAGRRLDRRLLRRTPFQGQSWTYLHGDASGGPYATMTTLKRVVGCTGTANHGARRLRESRVGCQRLIGVDAGDGRAQPRGRWRGGCASGGNQAYKNPPRVRHRERAGAAWLGRRLAAGTR